MVFSYFFTFANKTLIFHFFHIPCVAMCIWMKHRGRALAWPVQDLGSTPSIKNKKMEKMKETGGIWILCFMC